MKLSRVNSLFLVFLVLLAGCSAPLTREELREMNRYESLDIGTDEAYESVDGQQLHYLKQGHGRPVVLLHGFPTSSYTWRHVIPRLSNDYEVYAPDLPGYGKSDLGPQADRGISAQSFYIDEWMDSLGLSGTILVGQGIGGGVALQIAIRHPDKVAGLILINPACYDSYPSNYAKLLAEPGWGPFVGSGAARRGGFHHNLSQGVYHQKLLSDGVVDSYYAPWNSEAGRRNLIRAATDLKAKDMMEIMPRVRSLKVPTLVVAGLFDPFQSINYSKRLAAEIPGAQFIQIPNCGHFASEDEPEKIVRYVKTFFLG
ncbi:MAG: alpha/beta hydrolase [Candidatus Omnitrophica bacterium]|nr:alpha/beta hydrolase [Candidatus Omnitrophota bacterium]